MNDFLLLDKLTSDSPDLLVLEFYIHNMLIVNYLPRSLRVEVMRKTSAIGGVR